MFCFVPVSVRKPNKVDSIEDQVKMVTENIFSVIHGSYKFITRRLLTHEGVVFNLHYPGYRWKFLEGGV